MSNRVKSATALTLFVLMAGFYAYAAWTTAPTLAPQIIAYNKAHPLNWVDVGLGALLMFFVMIALFLMLSLGETVRFERSLKGGGGTGGSGGRKRVRMPMSWKKVDLDKWQPPDGRYHRGVVGTAA
jgi:hypothetical protein